MQGKRHDLDGMDFDLAPGEYGKRQGRWYACPPGMENGMGSLASHDVVEHEDGTITVSPSILITYSDGRQWHGYLECGVWREV